MMRCALPVALAATLSACAVGPNYRAPPVLTEEGPALVGGRGFDQTGPLPGRWWRLYDNPVLDALVQKALVHNTDLRQSLASLQQMRAMLHETESQLLPQTSVSASGTIGGARVETMGMLMVARPTTLYDASDSISYDLNLFGKVTRSIEEGQASVGEAQAMLDLMRVNVAAQTASAYVQSCSTGLSIAVTKRSIAVARRFYDVTQRRFDSGVAGFNDVIQTRTMLRMNEANLPSLLAQRRTALYMMATLTGDPPTAFPAAVADCASPPRLRRKIPIDDGAALIKRRPDVRAAERKLAGAIADIGVKTAQLYPSVTLTASIEAVKTNVLGSVTKILLYSAGPMLKWAFPNLSSARAQVEESNAAARSALASFDGYVLTALREADSALVTLVGDMNTERLDGLARDDAKLAYDNAFELYSGGKGVFYSVLDAERTLIQSESTLANATAQVSKDQVKLFMALGGGWQDAPEVADISAGQVCGSNCTDPIGQLIGTGNGLQ